MLLRVTVLIFVSFLASLPAAGQEIPDRCRDDRGANRCAADQQRRTLALYGMRPIEDHARTAEQVRRVFYVDGYGRDVIALAFVRAPGTDPTVWVHFPRVNGQPARSPLQAPVSDTVWQDVLTRSEHFDRDLVARPVPADPETMTICLHSWNYVVEATDPEWEIRESLGTRRQVDDACNSGLAAAYGNALEEIALPLFPYCAALDRQHHRTPASVLRACGVLEGDRVAAAAAYNATETLGADLQVVEDRWRLSRSFHDDATSLRRAADGNTEPFRFSTFLQGKDPVYLSVLRAVGHRADRVEVEAELLMYEQRGNQSFATTAPLTLVFTVRQNDPSLLIESASLGPLVAEREGGQ